MSQELENMQYDIIVSLLLLNKGTVSEMQFSVEAKSRLQHTLMLSIMVYIGSWDDLCNVVYLGLSVITIISLKEHKTNAQELKIAATKHFEEVDLGNIHNDLEMSM